MLFWCDVKFEKGEKKFAKRWIRTQVVRIKRATTYILLSASLELMTLKHLLYIWLAQAHVGVLSRYNNALSTFVIKITP